MESPILIAVGADAIKNKNFQPFFTTKPTGQGTGLGLNLSYDSEKLPWGNLLFITLEENDCTFIITLLSKGQ